MKAAVTERDGRTRVETLSDPGPSLDHALVRVVAAGLCGTDRHIASGKYPANLPRVLGHEVSGVVQWIDEVNNGIAMNDHVVIDPNIACYRCEYCRQGLVHLCSNRKAVGIDLNGGFSEFLTVPISQLYRMSPSVPLSFGALAEPLSCCVHGLDQLRIASGKRVAVVGLGPVGMLLSQLLLLQGCTEIVGLESSPDRLERAAALSIGAMHWDKRREYPPSYFDAVVDAVGASPIFEWGMDAVRPGGKILVFGVAPRTDTAQLSLYQLYNKEISIMSAHTNPFTMQRAVDLLESGQIDANAVLTHPLTLDDLPRALAQPQTTGLKMFVHFS